MIKKIRGDRCLGSGVHCCQEEPGRQRPSLHPLRFTSFGIGSLSTGSFPSISLSDPDRQLWVISHSESCNSLGFAPSVSSVQGDQQTKVHSLIGYLTFQGHHICYVIRCYFSLCHLCFPDGKMCKNHLLNHYQKQGDTQSHFNLAFSFQADLNLIHLNKTFYSVYNLGSDEYWILVR